MESKYTTLRIDVETYARLKKLAADNGRSLIGQIRVMLASQEPNMTPPPLPIPVIYVPREE